MVHGFGAGWMAELAGERRRKCPRLHSDEAAAAAAGRYSRWCPCYFLLAVFAESRACLTLGTCTCVGSFDAKQEEATLAKRKFKVTRTRSSLQKPEARPRERQNRFLDF